MVLQHLSPKREKDEGHLAGEECNRVLKVCKQSELLKLTRMDFQNASPARTFTPLCSLQSSDEGVPHGYHSVLNGIVKSGRAHFEFVHSNYPSGRRLDDGLYAKKPRSEGFDSVEISPVGLPLSLGRFLLRSFAITALVKLLRCGRCAFVCIDTCTMDANFHDEAANALKASQGYARWQRIKKHEPGLPRNLNFVFLPICHGSHWTLMYLDVEQRTRNDFDPKKAPRNEVK